MKVVQINAVCEYGSTGRICRELNDFLVQHGHEGTVLFGNGNSRYCHAKKISKDIEAKIHALLSRALGKNAAYSPVATSQIIGEIKRVSPDVVHLHNLHGNFVSIQPLLSYLAENDIPTVITLHDCWFFTGKCTHYTSAGCYKWQTGCGECPKLKNDIPSWLFDRTREMWQEKKNLFDSISRLAVVGVSDWITNEARKSFLSSTKILQRIYNWIDLDVFYPRGIQGCDRFNISREKFSVLCIGAGWSEDSVKTKDLFELAQKLDDDCEIILAGTVPFEDKLPENIKSIGYVSSTDELAQLYSACDVYVHLSREDTFGKVIAEALACGTPAIVYDATACPEIVGEGCGYAVETGNIARVLEKIQEVKRKGKNQFAAACVDSARRRFSKEKLLEDTLDLYERVCKTEED